MKPKPKRERYRNLTARGDTIYYQRRVGQQRIRFSCETADWETAAQVRDLYEARKRIGQAHPILEVRTFAQVAERYLKTARQYLAESSYEDRVYLLAETGAVGRYFGRMRLETITRGVLLDWWEREVEGIGRAHRTGLNHLNVVGQVLGHAVDHDLLADNPVDAFRGTLRRRRRTKRGRAEAETQDQRHPIEGLDALRGFVEASERAGRKRFGNGKPKVERQRGQVADLLMLDAGLRMGEVGGLRWRDVHWGDGPDDEARHLHIRESRARGRYDGAPKSGRARKVALSRRLRSVLRAYWLAQGQPSADIRVLPAFAPRNYSERHFAEVCRAAELEAMTPKCLRDTFASQLLTAGVPLAYVSAQLGHAESSVTERHYARWIDRDGYRRPLEVRPGEVPADLLARLKVTPNVTPHAISRENDAS